MLGLRLAAQPPITPSAPLTETFIDTLVSCKLSFWIAKRRLNFPVAFFVEAVLFIFKKEENKIPAIQQMV